MRLSTSQIEGIITAIKPYLQNHTAELRLYGSRLHDELKGGDIDLLLLVEREEQVSSLLMEKFRILSSIKKEIGDQKVDLLIASKDNLHQNNFLKMIFPESKVIHIFCG